MVLSSPPAGGSLLEPHQVPGGNLQYCGASPLGSPWGSEPSDLSLGTSGNSSLTAQGFLPQCWSPRTLLLQLAVILRVCRSRLFSVGAAVCSVTPHL